MKVIYPENNTPSGKIIRSEKYEHQIMCKLETNRAKKINNTGRIRVEDSRSDAHARMIMNRNHFEAHWQH